MKRIGLLQSRRGFGYIEIIIVTIIVLLLAGKFISSYYSKAPVADKETKEALSGQNLDTTSYTTVVDSAQKKVLEINKIQQDRIDAFKADEGGN